jgi:hypothetical protein
MQTKLSSSLVGLNKTCPPILKGLYSIYFTNSLDSWVLEETKLRPTQPSLVKLGLGLSLAIMESIFIHHF